MQSEPPDGLVLSPGDVAHYGGLAGLVPHDLAPLGGELLALAGGGESSSAIAGGLVVISSCSHCGVLNAVGQAMAVSGVDKLHAVLGGFHLGVAPPDYVEHTIAELKAMAPDVVIPMHCTGRAFIDRMRAEMPEQLVDWNTGSRFTFGV